MRKLPALLPALLFYSTIYSQPATSATSSDPRLAKATREDKAGWIYVHLEGSPKDIVFQHGSLLATEIDDLIKTMQYFLPHNSGKDWTFYREAVKKMFWNKIDPEYQEEITGMTKGLKTKAYHYDVHEHEVVNGNIELAKDHVPSLTAPSS